jgi:hypothetical protein
MRSRASEGEVRRRREGLKAADLLEKGLAGAYRGRPERGLHELTMRALALLRPPIRRILLFIGYAPTPVETHRHAHPIIYFASSNLRLTMGLKVGHRLLRSTALLSMNPSEPSVCHHGYCLWVCVLPLHRWLLRPNTMFGRF